jgi:hypothetical protein
MASEGQQAGAGAAAATTFPVGAPLKWTSERNQVLVNGRPFRIKGLNWFGFETEVSRRHGAQLLLDRSGRPFAYSPHPTDRTHPEPQQDNCLHGLWSGLGKSLTDYLDLVGLHGFNALRVPFSVKLALALDTTYPKDAGFVAADPSLRRLTSGAILDKCVALCYWSLSSSSSKWRRRCHGRSLGL